MLGLVGTTVSHGGHGLAGRFDSQPVASYAVSLRPRAVAPLQSVGSLNRFIAMFVHLPARRWRSAVISRCGRLQSMR
jgi:hypothetical protein